MKHYLFVGDAHGDLDFFQAAAEHAALHESEMIVVGDWGFIWARGGTVVDHTPQLQTILERAGQMFGQSPVTCRFVDGNHDHHVELRKRVGEDRFRHMDEEGWFCNECGRSGFGSPREICRGHDNPGGVYLQPNVIYQPRGSSHTDEDGTTFLFCGGAPSIDWMGRVEGASIWRELEHISEEEFQRALDVDLKIDVLVTHDAPAYPPGFGPKGDPEFRKRGARSMEMIAELARKHVPSLLVHGHWHDRATTMFGETKVVGLDCNNAFFDSAVMLWSRDVGEHGDVVSEGTRDYARAIPLCANCKQPRETRGFCAVCQHPNEAST